MRFSQQDLELHRPRQGGRDRDLEAADGPVHSTIIWASSSTATSSSGPWRGAGARWYREALANPTVAIQVDGKDRMPATRRPRHGRRLDRARASAGLERKYAGDPAAESMVRDEILGTTLRIEGA